MWYLPWWIHDAFRANAYKRVLFSGVPRSGTLRSFCSTAYHQHHHHWRHQVRRSDIISPFVFIWEAPESVDVAFLLTLTPACLKRFWLISGNTLAWWMVPPASRHAKHEMESIRDWRLFVIHWCKAILFGFVLGGRGVEGSSSSGISLNLKSLGIRNLERSAIIKRADAEVNQMGTEEILTRFFVTKFHPFEAVTKYVLPTHPRHLHKVNLNVHFEIRPDQIILYLFLLHFPAWQSSNENSKPFYWSVPSSFLNFYCYLLQTAGNWVEMKTTTVRFSSADYTKQH